MPDTPNYTIWGELAEPRDAFEAINAIDASDIWRRTHGTFGLYSRGDKLDWHKDTTYMVRPWLIHVYDRRGGTERIARYVVETPSEEYLDQHVIEGRKPLSSIPRDQLPPRLAEYLTQRIRPDLPDSTSIEYLDQSDLQTLNRRYADTYPARVAINAILRLTNQKVGNLTFTE